MAAPASTYDLMLLLDVNLDDAQRSKILDDTRALVQAHGTVVSDNEYGRRSMAYEIDHQPDVDYALLQFQGPSSLLEQLSRTLRITDGVVRFRVIKIRPDAPAAPDLRQSAVPAPEAAEAVAEPAAG
jgi:small subunit ribosomal protein S6